MVLVLQLLAEREKISLKMKLSVFNKIVRKKRKLYHEVYLDDELVRSHGFELQGSNHKKEYTCIIHNNCLKYLLAYFNLFKVL